MQIPEFYIMGYKGIAEVVAASANVITPEQRNEQAKVDHGLNGMSKRLAFYELLEKHGSHFWRDILRKSLKSCVKALLVHVSVMQYVQMWIRLHGGTGIVLRALVALRFAQIQQPPNEQF
jgi:hypothetical protein